MTARAKRGLEGTWLICLYGLLWLALGAWGATLGRAAEPWESALQQPVLGAEQALAELRQFFTPRIAEFKPLANAEDWPARATALREEILRKVVLRGRGADWQQGPVRVEWLDEQYGGPAQGYTLRRLRYEAVPGLWIPAVLYSPTGIAGKLPVFLNVNGHDPAGKAADYKQIRCIQLAKRGVLVLNPEWLGMGQLRGPGYLHGEMNQLDLVGTSGLAPFYLALSRGLDVLLELPEADRSRVGVAGLSGGGWQTIVLSALDPRVTLCNPVAGYSSLKTRLVSLIDLGDSEQTPVDLANLADYTHLTALLAPRPALLTYNLTDNCCFQARDALPPLLATARPIYRQLGADQNLRYHINAEPGDHNFGLENREALYAMVGVHFFDGARDYPVRELPMESELKSPVELSVPLPEGNATFGSLAKSLAVGLPRGRTWTGGGQACRQWQPEARRVLTELTRNRWSEDEVVAVPISESDRGGVSVRTWRLGVRDLPTLPLIELVPPRSEGCVVLVGDQGKASLVPEIADWLARNRRICVCDPVFVGEVAQGARNYLFELVAGSVGERPAGMQAAQIAAVARWRKSVAADEPLELVVRGPRLSLAGLMCSGTDPGVWQRVLLHDPLVSLHQLLEQNRRFEELPEAFCFGLLERFDMVDLAALAWPTTVDRRFSDAKPQDSTEERTWQQLSQLQD